MTLTGFSNVTVVLALFLPLGAIAGVLDLVANGKGRANRRMSQQQGRTAQQNRATMSSFVQLGAVGMVAILASYLINVSSSYFTASGRFVWVDSLVPLLTLSAALILVEFSAIYFVRFLERPVDRWITSPWALAATLRAAWSMAPRGSVEVAQWERKYDEFADQTGLHTARRLKELGLWSATAEREWPTRPDHDSVWWAARIEDALTWDQVVRWLLRRHWLVLAVTVVCATTPEAFLAVAPLPPRWSHPLQAFVSLVLVLVVLSVWPAVRAGRRELVFVIRICAQRDAALDECRDLLDRIRAHPTAHASDDSGEDRLLLAIGRWRLCRAR